MTQTPLAEVPLPAPGLLIGTDRLAESSGGSAVHRFPATGEPDQPIPMAGAREIDFAVTAATAAAAEWRALTPDRRRDALLRLADVVDQHGDELVALSIRDSGFPLRIAALGPSRASGGLRYYAGWADKIVGDVVPTWSGPAFDYAVSEPIGVIGFFATWNTPVYNLGLTVAPALAAGNAIILKPSELAPYAYLRFGELCLEAGLPPGLVNVVPGGAEAGTALVEHPGVGKVHFTGGGTVGRRVAALAAEHLKPIDLELGGKSANLIFPDADLERAVAVSVDSIHGGSGQTCITAGRMIVHESVVDEVVEIAREQIARHVLGDPFDAGTTMGPVITEAARTRILGMVDRAIREGAELCAGAAAAVPGPGGDLAGGYFVEPTLLVGVHPDSELAQTEVYGPVLSVSTFGTESEAVALANGTPFGLSSYLQTRDVSRVHRMAARLSSGSVYVNGRGGIGPGMPFGGYKESGYGRLGGREGLMTFMQSKNVWISMDDD
ncbi:aldehyde dehydrogenase family protein [Actinomadura bangladeshensis]|uniref:Aldehyde dehydrogenase family protein n=1 Tax=Actinomadura bangladeshensis TaxID=453573 RepID=A0A4R4PF18_9ACTN|nr:aldehyde dehydrogenase family protein [Actinomadura bangladeshensis]TDC20392.1 aldehyde dehydrogenase family protein [Actinomadura bangladeshensis]